MKKTYAIIFLLLICTLFSACHSTACVKLTPPAVTPAPTETEPLPAQASEMPEEEPVQTAPVYESLAKGDEEESVELLQNRLIELGYMRGSADGKFGSATERAVNLYKRQSGVSEDGIADENIQEELFGEDAAECVFPLAGYIIGVDPGHQGRGNADLEPVSPGSSKMKKKVSSGTQGRFSGVPEHEVNLEVGLLLKKMLEENGAFVVMTRESKDVDISNIERAKVFNSNKTDYAIRLHCNGSENAGISGAFILIPDKNAEKENCERAAELLISEYCEATGAVNLGIVERSDQTCFNWCERMIVNIEMGHMSNEKEDFLLASPEYREKMAEGILNGILAYFE